MRYGSVCSGIEAATVAWEPLGWEPAFFSEIERFPRAVLKHHYPQVPLHGDFQTIKAGDYGTVDLLVGGTPCQDFSIAGLRAGMDGERGNLALEFLRLAGRLRPRWILWENVPGILSSNGGRDFGSFLGGLGELGYGFAYRCLDAQYFGLAQRRLRVFVVGYLGD
jgi:DNA (cytosine-5)-methyltransferase 1